MSKQEAMPLLSKCKLQPALLPSPACNGNNQRHSHYSTLQELDFIRPGGEGRRRKVVTVWVLVGLVEQLP